MKQLSKLILKVQDMVKSLTANCKLMFVNVKLNDKKDGVIVDAREFFNFIGKSKAK